jgi:hypothetical protein
LKRAFPESDQQFERRLRIEARAEAEAEWFYRTLGGRVPADASTGEGAAARGIEQWLSALPPFHRGAFALHYTPRAWPEPLVDEFRSEVSLVVRLECAMHPAVGKSVAELEAASIERLTALIAESKKERARRKGRNATPGPHQRQLARFFVRAYEHVGSATRALAKVRGDAPCAVPGWVERKPEACE